MSITDSYPYLQIAKRHQLEYGEVLQLADYVTHGRGDCSVVLKEWPGQALREVTTAASRFKAIQDGAIPFPTT